jgi:hypothetical protein
MVPVPSGCCEIKRIDVCSTLPVVLGQSSTLKAGKASPGLPRIGGRYTVPPFPGLGVVHVLCFTGLVWGSLVVSVFLLFCFRVFGIVESEDWCLLSDTDKTV